MVSFPQPGFGRSPHLDILDVHSRTWKERSRYLCAFIRDLTRSIGNIWRRWYLELSERGYKTSENLAAGVSVSVSRRDAGVQTRKRKLGSYVESPDRSACQVNPHRDSLTRHQPTTRYFALIYRYSITYCILQIYTKISVLPTQVTRKSIIFA